MAGRLRLESHFSRVEGPTPLTFEIVAPPPYFSSTEWVSPWPGMIFARSLVPGRKVCKVVLKGTYLRSEMEEAR